MLRTYARAAVAILVLAATAIVFVFYLKSHPDIVRQLRKIPASTFFILLLLYGIFLGTLIWIQRAVLAMCDIRLGRSENIVLVMYSSLINFFGPLQSGPAFRGAYLKRRHNIKLRTYTVATLLYYGFYAAFSGMFLLTFWYGPVVLLGLIVLVVLARIILLYPAYAGVRLYTFRAGDIADLAVASLAQVSSFAAIFYVELNHLGQHVSLVPSLIYTGAANFALFVSLTPGAIGFREAFVLFTQKLHHITSSQIVTASLADRGVYIAFLGLLAVFVFGLHAKNYLQPTDTAIKRP